MSNKTSDKNVANIEEDVKILEEFAEICKAGLACYDQTREGKALENILAEREQMIAEKKKYTIRLTDEEYRKVIENAQMDTSNDRVITIKFAIMQQQINEKDKQIQELEKENTKYKNSFNQQVEILKDTIKKLNESIPKQAIIDLIENETINISGFECVAIEDIQELLGGEK